MAHALRPGSSSAKLECRVTRLPATLSLNCDCKGPAITAR